MTTTLRASALRGYPALVRELGGDPQPLTERCGLALADLDDPERIVPLGRALDLLDHTARSLGCADFGLRLARTQDIGVLGPLALAMQNARTVSEALGCGARYLHVQSPALILNLNIGPRTAAVELGIVLRDAQQDAMRHGEDLMAGVCLGVLEYLAGDRFELLAVELPARPADLEDTYQRFFRVPVATDRPAVVLRLSRATVDVPLKARSEALSRIAADYLAAQFPDPDGRYAGRVELAVRHTLGTDRCNRAAIANAMALHPRTLQRHLGREHRTFEQIRDGVRRERAHYYLRHTDMPLSQVATQLGYRDQSILTRGCRRWFGTTPLRYRRRS